MSHSLTPSKYKPAEEKKESVPYIPGDLTEEKHRLPSHDDLAKNRLGKTDFDCPKGYPRVVSDDFHIPEPEVDITKEANEMYEKHRQLMCSEFHSNGDLLAERKIRSPLLQAISNFTVAKKLHKENLEHDPLPDTFTHAMMRKMQLEKDEIENRVTGIGWKAYGAYGPTRCTKLRVFRPKTCIHNKIINQHENRPSSVSSFDKKWRFIRQSKVTPIDLAICWDLTPENVNDEPKRPTHIDGSNGSMAPAVFTLVHTPKENEPKKELPVKCDGIHACGPLFEHRKQPENIKNYFFERPRTSSVQSGSSSSHNSQKVRAKSANNIHDIDSHSLNLSDKSNKAIHQSIPNLQNIQCEKCNKRAKYKKAKHCTACQLKNALVKEKKPKNEFKLAFKAGCQQRTVSTKVKILKIPKQKDPYSYKPYKISSLAAPFSLQNYKRQDYPEHWRLATVYQQSYKPIESRKRPLIQTIYK